MRLKYIFERIITEYCGISYLTIFTRHSIESITAGIDPDNFSGSKDKSPVQSCLYYSTSSSTFLILISRNVPDNNPTCMLIVPDITPVDMQRKICRLCVAMLNSSSEEGAPGKEPGNEVG